jgi:hypothetical protein
VLTAAQLLAEGLSDKGGFAAGFDWAEDQLRQAGLGKIAAEVRACATQQVFNICTRAQQLASRPCSSSTMQLSQSRLMYD